jgi:hypothetical protein
LRTRALVAAGVLIIAVFVGTAVAGSSGSVKRDALVRTRVWCESLVARDALRYQETFRRNYFRGTFDRFANQYREPKESAIRAQMPRAQSCRAPDGIRPGPRGDVYVPVEWRDGDQTSHASLRLRRESGFLLITQIE